MHGHTAPRLPTDDPVAQRIAMLSEEYLKADAARQDQIGEEISALIEGVVVPLSQLS